jgi:hypothetical protein
LVLQRQSLHRRLAHCRGCRKATFALLESMSGKFEKMERGLACDLRRILNRWDVDCRSLPPVAWKIIAHLTAGLLMPLSKRSVDPRSLRSPEALSFVPFTRCTVMTCRARSRAPDASQSSLTMKTSPVAASRPPFPCSSMLPCSDREECRRLGCGMRVS